MKILVNSFSMTPYEKEILQSLSLIDSCMEAKKRIESEN
jgi:hypothetical protein